MMTSWFLAANYTLMARPMPLLAPVTMATRLSCLSLILIVLSPTSQTPEGGRAKAPEVKP